MFRLNKDTLPTINKNATELTHRLKRYKKTFYIIDLTFHLITEPIECSHL